MYIVLEIVFSFDAALLGSSKIYTFTYSADSILSSSKEGFTLLELPFSDVQRTVFIFGGIAIKSTRHLCRFGNFKCVEEK